MSDLRKRALDHLKYWCKGTPSEEGIRVAELLEMWQGLHHMNSQQMRKADWTRFFVELRFDSSVSPGGLSTFDFNALTALVFLAHDLCIRVDIGPCNMRFFTVMFHPRRSRTGSSPLRHPTLEEAVALWRRSQPVSDFFRPEPIADPLPAEVGQP